MTTTANKTSNVTYLNTTRDNMLEWKRDVTDSASAVYQFKFNLCTLQYPTYLQSRLLLYRIGHSIVHIVQSSGWGDIRQFMLSQCSTRVPHLSYMSHECSRTVLRATGVLAHTASDSASAVYQFEFNLCKLQYPTYLQPRLLLYRIGHSIGSAFECI